jgi:23S rRNA (pseudouridine1915-N3)-methyltransferase
MAGSLRVRVIAVGRVKERGIREAVDDYATRIGRHARFEEVELTDGEPDEVRERFDKAVGERSRVVALEVNGKAMTSEQLAEYVGRCEGEGVSELAFLIGGAYGLPIETSRVADVRLSLSAMTLPHRLCRLFLMEQVYRAFTILRNEPYNH